MKIYKSNSCIRIDALLGADFACFLSLPKELPMHIT